MDFIFRLDGNFVGGAFICWLANPLLILSWLVFYKGNTKVPLVLSCLSTILAFSFLIFEEIMINEAGHYGAITGYGVGYWLWSLSSLIMVLGSLLTIFNGRRTEVNN
ncbi:hypothetical protein [Nafulsella turpanensis]|uniref:hypothetical protein n=1 Tax=Nafulsella turpanensis TaxID=1265690 RepID=UPI00135F10F8|nr:hypothetical protein [Nafulsella turpanensis]